MKEKLKNENAVILGRLGGLAKFKKVGRKGMSEMRRKGLKHKNIPLGAKTGLKTLNKGQ